MSSENSPATKLFEVRGQRWEAKKTMTSLMEKNNPVSQTSDFKPRSSASLPKPSPLDPQTTFYIFPFEKLDVWKMAVELTDYILGLLEQIPLNKHFRLVSQMAGAVTSVPQNVAEGKGRQYKKEFIQYLSIAQGSLYETITLNEIFMRRKLFSEKESKEIRRRGEEIDRKLNGLMNALRGRQRAGY